jgi:hypothetical protein
MTNFGKHIAGPRSSRMLLPALLFFACASLSAAWGGAVVALCLIPAGLVIDAVRGDGHDPSREA